MVEMSPPETLLDTVAAAQQLGVSLSFLAKARMQGTGPRYRKLGRAVRYRRGILITGSWRAAGLGPPSSSAVMPPSRKPPSR